MTPTIPEGYVAFGWYTGGRSLNPRSTNMGVWESVVHLAPADQARLGATGRARRPYQAVCGRTMRTRAGMVEWPESLAHEVAEGRRTLCPRCIAKVGTT